MRRILAILAVLVAATFGVLTETPEPALAYSVALQADSATITLNWTAPADTDLATYEWRAFKDNGPPIFNIPFTETGSLTTSHTFKLVRTVAGYNFTACVRAKDLGGFTGPEDCNIITIAALDVPPGAVSNLTHTVTY